MGKAFKLRNGMLLLSTEAPGGIYNSAQLQKIATLVDTESAIVKATEDQRLAIFVKPERVKHFASELKAVGIGLRNFQDGIHQPTACLGKHCPEYQQDALSTAMDLSDELASLSIDTPLRLGVNGCARCCVPCHTLDISIVGDSGGYRISLGGKNSQIPEMASFMAEGVPADKVAKLIGKVVKVYKELAEKDETLQETIERAGPSKFIQALAPFSQDAAGGSDDPFGSFDAGEETVSGPTVEHDSESMAFDKEPAVESFADEASLDDSVMAFDEPLPDASDDLMTEVVPETMSDDDLTIADEAMIEDSGMESIADEPANDDMLVDTVDHGQLSDDVVLDRDVSDAEAPPSVPVSAGQAMAAAAASTTLASSIVAKASAAAASESDEGLGAEAEGAEEVEGDAADEFEEKLNASIAEEESMPILEDVNSNSRLEAMRLVEAGGEVHEELQVDGGFDNLGIEDTVEATDHEGFESELSAPESDDNTVFDQDNQDQTAEDSRGELGSFVPQVTKSDGDFQLVAIEFIREGRLSLQFSTGAAVIVDPKTIRPGSSRELRVSGKILKITAEKHGVSVEADGVGLFLPRAAA